MAVENQKSVDIPVKQIRAVYDEKTIRIYQAYSDPIADSALEAGNFVSPPFKMSRMTWIKPSFLWMMYRAGWGFKDAEQKRILAIDITREGFEWALKNSCPSSPKGKMSKAEYEALKRSSPVRIQWDPERDLLLNALPYRSIQIGLTGDAVERYVGEWIQQITEVTALAHEVRALVIERRLEEARSKLPIERPLPMDHI